MMILKVAPPAAPIQVSPARTILSLLAMYFADSLPVPHFVSVSAAIGFIALFGQAVLNGVVMVSYFNELREKGASIVEAATEGAMVRLRTVLMTSCLAMLGLLPMALSKAMSRICRHETLRYTNLATKMA